MTRVLLADAVAALLIWHNHRRDGEIKSTPKRLNIIFDVKAQVHRYHPEMRSPVVRQTQVKVPVPLYLFYCLASLELLLRMAEPNAEQ